MYRIIPLSLLTLGVSAAAVGAQEIADSRAEIPRFRAPPVFERVEPLSSQTTEPTDRPAAWITARERADAEAPAGTESREGAVSFTWRGLAHTIGGALVGGWLGFVGSQVVKGDWEKDSNGSLRNHRTLLTAAGALAGVVGSRLIGHTRPPRDAIRPGPRQRSDRLLTREEIAESEARDAYELISGRRPQWLVERGVHSHTEADQGYGRSEEFRVKPGADKIMVYLDDIRVGGVPELKQFSTNLLTSARFLDAREATYRYGSGHTHGAIVLSTGVRSP